MEDQELGKPTSAVSKSRLEFLFDGIFAIAMTILVLELKVPEGLNHHSVSELGRALAHHGATFFSYMLSFVVLGVLWYRSNQTYRHFHHITKPMLVLHLVQLAMAASFPFCASLFGRYPINPLSMVFYSGCILVYAWASFAQWVTAHISGAMNPSLSQVDYKRDFRRSLRGCVVITVIFMYFLVRTVFVS
jgi:uncharacterized membrane protein